MQVQVWISTVTRTSLKQLRLSTVHTRTFHHLCIDLDWYYSRPNLSSRILPNPALFDFFILSVFIAPFSPYLSNFKTPRTLHIISRPKAGVQPPIASSCVNPDFNCLAISSTPSSNFETAKNDSIGVGRAKTRTFLSITAASSCTSSHTVRLAPSFAEPSSFAKVDSEEHITVKHGAD